MEADVSMFSLGVAMQARHEAQSLKQAFFLSLINLTSTLRLTGVIDERATNSIASALEYAEKEVGKEIGEPGLSLLQSIVTNLRAPLPDPEPFAENVQPRLEVIQDGKNDD